MSTKTENFYKGKDSISSKHYTALGWVLSSSEAFKHNYLVISKISFI